MKYSQGFAYGISYTDHKDEMSHMINYIISHFGEHEEPCLVFDGDNLSSDSFTHLIPHLVAQIPHMEVWAVLSHEGEIERFNNSWEFSGVPIIHVSAFENIESYTHLGITALRHTMAEHVFCFGGGKCISDEYEEGKHIATYRVLPVKRINREGNEESCELGHKMECIVISAELGDGGD
jgi:hypothetical protein